MVAAARIDVDLFSLVQHEAAELFPMMDEAALRELADDIRVNGLREEVVLVNGDTGLTILDGRNRLLACRMAGVEPRYTIWEAHGPVGY